MQLLWPVLGCSVLSRCSWHHIPILRHSFVSQLLCFPSSSLLMIQRKQQIESNNWSTLGPCNVHGSPRWNFGILALTWPSPSQYNHLGEELVDERMEDLALFLLLSLILPLKQINLNFKEKANERQWNRELETERPAKTTITSFHLLTHSPHDCNGSTGLG